jgi:hypothetical protein
MPHHHVDIRRDGLATAIGAHELELDWIVSAAQRGAARVDSIRFDSTRTSNREEAVARALLAGEGGMWRCWEGDRRGGVDAWGCGGVEAWRLSRGGIVRAGGRGQIELNGIGGMLQWRRGCGKRWVDKTPPAAMISPTATTSSRAMIPLQHP